MDDVSKILSAYPRIYFACHSRHRRDLESTAVLSAHQASVLDHLHSEEPTTMKDLAEHMGVTPSTMSLTVERLVRGGYVTRQRDQRDARRVHLLLSAAGARMKAAQSVLDPVRVAKLLARMSDEDRAAATLGLAKLAEAANAEIASWPGTSGGKHHHD